MKRSRICLAASSGGHFEQLLMLKPLLKEYDGFFYDGENCLQSSSKRSKNEVCATNKPKGKVVLV